MSRQVIEPNTSLIQINSLTAAQLFSVFFFNGSTALAGPWPVLQFLNNFFTQTVGLLGRVINPFARPLPTHRTTQTHNKRMHRLPYLDWVSKPRSQRSSERRQTQTVRPL
jgi:hypothetical protein